MIDEKLVALLRTKAKSAGSPKLVPVPPRESKGSGKPLPAPMLEAAQEVHKMDLSKVRIHECPTVKQIKADAYVSGFDIVFAPGRSGDITLVAHEVAHVVQQRGRVTPGKGAV